MIYGNNTLKTSSSATGCTGKCESICASPKGYPDLRLRLVDTIGLGESIEGTVPTGDAITELENKLDSLHSNEGIHLILFCIRKGRQNEATTRNYEGIVHELCERKVPCLLVITHCEDDEPLGEWWKSNKKIISERLKLDVRDAVSVTTMNSRATSAIYEESRKTLIEAIREYDSREPWKSENFLEKVRSIFEDHIRRSDRLRQERSNLDNYLQRPMESPASTANKSFRSWISSWFH